MIENFEEVSDDRFRGRRFDACVVGSGPAGVTLARRLAAAGLSVGLFEAGGLDQSDESQECYEGNTAGQPYYPLDACRLRFFGGSSNHWGGWTRALDAHDFEPRPDHPMSGWPIGKTDLDPYAAEADEILSLPPNRPPPTLFPEPLPELNPGMFRFSRPIVHFGDKYRDELTRAAKIEVFLNANLVDLRTDSDGRKVTGAVFQSYGAEPPITVEAGVYVLCLGGIENARMLLNADRQAGTGLGNGHDLVGRYFLEHPHAPSGLAVIRQPLSWMIVYSPSEALMRDATILNFGVRIGSFAAWNGPEFTGKLEDVEPCDVPFENLLAAQINGKPLVCPNNVVDVFTACEQRLDPDNRVRLIEDRDRFGLRRVELDWRLSDMDLRTHRTAAIKIASLFAESDTGRMRIVDWILNKETPDGSQLWGGNHHMGTTRMSDDPRRGVVDADCRVHSLDNLYIGGSSVFATSGHANPTYTIVQLALRLGDHLRRRLGRA